MPLLQTKNMGIDFGGLRAVSEMDLEISGNELVGLIGPNGSGKTTTFNLLTGVYSPTEGEILLNGKSIASKKPSQINNLGIARTFQNIRLFKDLTAIENIKAAFHSQMKYNAVQGILRTKTYYREENETHEKAMGLLEVMGLSDIADNISGGLPYGKQRKLEIARALATKPVLLLLDEPAAGMNPSETGALMETIRLIKDRFNIAVLLIEHDMNLVMGICERLLVLDYGMVIAAGKPDEIKNNKKVIEAYLGA